MFIETQRLIITEFTMDMANAVKENSVDDDNIRFVPDEVWETTEEAEETLKFLISQYGTFKGPLVYPIIVKRTNDNVGYVELCPIDDGNWEIGYHIAKKYTGNGYATEAVKAFLPVIARQVNISEIYGICLAENKASLSVMRKCGFENVFSGIGLYQGAEREIVKNVWRVKSKMILETERLILRPFTENDAADVYEYLHKSAVNCFSSMKLKTLENAKAEMKNRKEETEYYFAITLKDGGKVIGEIDAYPEPGDSHDNENAPKDTFSPCWMLNEKYQGKGYAFEAAHAFFDYLFKNKGARRIYAYTEDYNLPSQHLCEKLGMRKEGLFLEFISFVNNPDGTPHYENTYQYAILKKEWNG